MWTRAQLVEEIGKQGLFLLAPDINTQVDAFLRYVESMSYSCSFVSVDEMVTMFREFVGRIDNTTDLSSTPYVYTFMNKNTELFDVMMQNGVAIQLNAIRDNYKHLMPMMLTAHINKDLLGVFNSWWRGRTIPASRDGVKELLWHLRDSFYETHIQSLEHLAEKAMGLSLSDQYWVRPSEDLTWDKVNFFTNSFSDDIGKLLLNGDWDGGDLCSPDNTSDGVVKKRWKIINNIRCLIKGSSSTVGYIGAQPRREVLASKLARVMLRPFSAKFAVPYTITTFDDEIFSVCPNFVTPNTEYVQFNQLVVGRAVRDYKDAFQYCRSFYGEQSFVIDIMLILDYIILNEDRHTGNFGLIRDVTTGEIVSPAPIFDTGSSLFHNSISTNVNTVGAKPFHKNHDIQISLVNIKNYHESLILVKEQIVDIYYDVFSESNEGDERIDRMLQILSERINHLLSL